VLLVAAGAGVYVGLAPKVVASDYKLPSATQNETLITEALSADAANKLLTAGAPQQSVVNGWTARDLLTIVAKENADILRAQGAVVDATGSLQTNPSGIAVRERASLFGFQPRHRRLDVDLASVAENLDWKAARQTLVIVQVDGFDVLPDGLTPDRRLFHNCLTYVAAVQHQ
jgi:hypothetical protein